jgi:hypothetical protein
MPGVNYATYPGNVSGFVTVSPPSFFARKQKYPELTKALTAAFTQWKTKHPELLKALTAPLPW